MRKHHFEKNNRIWIQKKRFMRSRKCFRYVIHPHLQFSADFPGEFDALAGSKGVLGYIVERRKTENDSATSASSHYHDNGVIKELRSSSKMQW